MNTPPILVVGSINMDLVISTSRVPVAGQTVFGDSFVTVPGGKGANQAVGVARLAGSCTLVGRLGQDAFGTQLRQGLTTNGVDTRFVMDTPKVSSGVALIMVETGGENRILVANGANAALTPEDLSAAEDAFRGASVCLLQLEVPIPTVLAAIALCHKHGVKVILDPAPIPTDPLPKKLYDVDVLTPNETEAVDLIFTRPGLPADHMEEKLDESHIFQSGELELEARATATTLLERGAKTVVLKMGKHGSLFACLRPESMHRHVPPFPIRAVDTTAAGDAFTAGLGVSLAEGKDWHQALRFANACGALACTVLGAQPSLPTREAVEHLLKTSSAGKP